MCLGTRKTDASTSPRWTARCVRACVDVEGKESWGKPTCDVVDLVLDNEPVAVVIIAVLADLGGGECLGHDDGGGGVGSGVGRGLALVCPSECSEAVVIARDSGRGVERGWLYGAQSELNGRGGRGGYEEV